MPVPVQLQIGSSLQPIRRLLAELAMAGAKKLVRVAAFTRACPVGLLRKERGMNTYSSRGGYRWPEEH